MRAAAACSASRPAVDRELGLPGAAGFYLHPPAHPRFAELVLAFPRYCSHFSLPAMLPTLAGSQEPASGSALSWGGVSHPGLRRFPMGAGFGAECVNLLPSFTSTGWSPGFSCHPSVLGKQRKMALPLGPVPCGKSGRSSWSTSLGLAQSWLLGPSAE